MYIRKIIHIGSLALFLTAFFSCNANKTESNKDMIDSDSIANEPLFNLPDTCYASAEKVKYRIDSADSLDHPLIEDTLDRYAQQDVCTFRMNPMRNADFGGHVTGIPDTIEVAWRFDTGYDFRETVVGSFGGGTGWTGQPLYIKSKNQIIIGSLCAKAYFLDYETGKEMAPAISTHNPIKGTPSLDLEMNNLYIGQGVPSEQPFGHITIDLTSHKETFSMGRDPKAQRGWGAYDPSAIIVGGYLFWPGENGTLYKFKRKPGGLELVSALRYTVNGIAPGMENSLCVYRNYGYTGDNRGNIICVNLNTMKPVWWYDNHDDIDATPVCEVENGIPYVYIGCEVDKRTDLNKAHLVKLNGLTGEPVWEQVLDCHQLVLGKKHLDGGFYGTPLLGVGDSKDMLFDNVCRNGGDGRGSGSGQFIAFSKKDGHIVYTIQLNQFAWSSPVYFLNEKNEMIILTGDSGGTLYLIKAKTGEVLFKKCVASNFESSPCVIGNTAVVGSRGNGIFKFVIKKK